MQRVIISSTCYHTFSMVWGLLATSYHALPSNVLKKYILMLKKTITRDNTLQIAQNQANLRESIR